MENTERTEAGGTPYHEDEPITAQGVNQNQGPPGEGGNQPGQGGNPNQGGKSDESGRIGQGGSGLEDEEDENEVGSPRKEPDQGDGTKNPAMQVNASDETPSAA